MYKCINLQKLSLKNFKGIMNLSIDFNAVTNIYGDNATGKTTIFDAFTWLLFDKDSRDRTNFEIKTLDTAGQPIHGVDHEVIGILNIDGRELKLQKTFHEKWTKKRGEAESTLTGHETLYYVDDVPVKQSEYKDKVNSIIDESIFKLITNPLYFSMNLKWQDRRIILLSIVGDITTEAVINYNIDLRPLEAILVDKDIDTLKRSISARKKKLNDDIKEIPPRIDECNNSISDLDFDALEFRKRTITPAIRSFEEQLIDSSKASDEILKEKENLYSLKSKILEMEHKAEVEKDKPLYNLQNNLNSTKHQIQDAEYNLSSLNQRKQQAKAQITEYVKMVENLRNEWYEVNSQVPIFNENQFICPTCKRPFDESNIDELKQELTKNFYDDKDNKLRAINSKGSDYKNILVDANNSLDKFENEIAAAEITLEKSNKQKKDIEASITNFVPADPLENNLEYHKLKSQAESLEAKLSRPSDVNIKIQEIKQKKRDLELEVEGINKQLAKQEQNEKLKARIEELKSEEKALGQQIADIEKQEFLCENFIKTKVELLESSINNKFDLVTFKLFETQVNGGLNECCEALVNGVPFSNANTAAQYNAGLDIINALSDYYQVSAPIFIDNRESVNNLIDTNAQIINLIVSKDKTLRIESEEI